MMTIACVDYSRSEKVADGTIHILGLTFAVGACISLVYRALTAPSLQAGIGLCLYAIGIAAMLACSALYNLSGPGPRKDLFRRLDHAAIFLMIAGTYSPYSLIGLRGTTGLILLSFVWTVALAGAAVKLFFPGRLERLSVPVYLLLGWSGLVAIHSLIGKATGETVLLLALGGILYTVGVIFHLSRRLPYHNAIWHGFVLMAVVCHFFSIAGLAVTAG